MHRLENEDRILSDGSKRTYPSVITGAEPLTRGRCCYYNTFVMMKEDTVLKPTVTDKRNMSHSNHNMLPLVWPLSRTVNLTTRRGVIAQRSRAGLHPSGHILNHRQDPYVTC